MAGIWNKIGATSKVVAVIALCVALSLGYRWYRTPDPVAGVVTEAPVAKVVEKLTTHEVPATKLVVYDKKEVAKKVHLPESVKTNDKQEVTKVADVMPSKAGVTATVVVDKETGKTTVLQEAKKLPLFGFGGELRAGVGVGVGSRGPEKNVHISYDAIRIGNTWANVRGEATDRGERRATVNYDIAW